MTLGTTARILDPNRQRIRLNTAAPDRAFSAMGTRAVDRAVKCATILMDQEDSQRKRRRKGVLTTTTRIGMSIQEERVLWLLHRGEGRASLLRPASSHHSFDLGQDVSLGGTPIEAALAAARAFMSSHAEWVTIWSIPAAASDAREALARAQEVGARKFVAEEAAEVLALEMDTPLGVWARADHATLLAMEDG